MLNRLVKYILNNNMKLKNDVIDDLKCEILKDYLDKNVISVRIDEFNRPEKSGERIYMENVILHQSIINNSIIETDGLLQLGSYNILSNNITSNK